MYIPQAFAESRVEQMHGLMRKFPLATLVRLGADGLAADHIPLQLSAEPLPWGCLRGHVARTNPVWRDCPPKQEVLAVFHGPNAYISPSWYASKAVTGKAVPTWNYAVVHAYGRLRVHDDPAWLLAMLESLTDRHESAFPDSWKLADAPDGFVESLLPSIVGIEITISRLEGKWKTSQNRPAPDRAGVANGLAEIGSPDSLTMAGLVWLGL